MKALYNKIEGEQNLETGSVRLRLFREKESKSKTKEGSFMKKKWMEGALAVTLACTMFAGCGQSAGQAADGESVSADSASSGTETVADETGTEAEDNGTVTLTV